MLLGKEFEESGDDSSDVRNAVVAGILRGLQRITDQTPESLINHLREGMELIEAQAKANDDSVTIREIRRINQEIGKPEAQEAIRHSFEKIRELTQPIYDKKIDNIAKIQEVAKALGRGAAIIDAALLVDKVADSVGEGDYAQAAEDIGVTAAASVLGGAVAALAVGFVSGLGVSGGLLVGVGVLAAAITATAVSLVFPDTIDYLSSQLTELLVRVDPLNLFPDSEGNVFSRLWDFFTGDNPFDNPLISPLIIDLDGDGVELTSLGNSQTHFDLDGNGFAQRTGWVTGDDAFLAIDRNGDGKINDINELFGNANTDGFTELSELDTNNDGVIDANDAAFASLMLWQDRDGDGVTDEGELISLTDAGIISIDLQATAIDETNNGHDVSHRSRVMMDDGSERTIDDVWFANDRSDTQRIAGDDEAPAGGLASEGIPYLCSLAQITDLQNASIGTLCGIKLTSCRRNAFKMHGVVS